MKDFIIFYDIMDYGKKKVFCLFFIWISSCILSSNGAAINKLAKFDFPPFLTGINHSAIDDLQPYLKYNPVDLGIDILDDDAPMHIREALANASLSDDVTLNQIAAHEGLPRLLKAVAKLYSKMIGREIDPENEVLITAGATEAVYAAFHGHTIPGDEWVVIQPAYSMYLPMIKMARGIPRFATLSPINKEGDIHGDDWVFDKKEMESLFNEKTKGILLNNPVNPLGKVYTREELEFIASLAIKYNTLVISDEAHEWITQKPHTRIASLPGMYERTITIGSAAKSFSVSGWRIGWAYGPAYILNHLKTIHKYSLDSSPTPQQEAIAFGFEEEIRHFGKPGTYFVSHTAEIRSIRNKMVKVFKDVGMVPIIPDGGYCMIADWTPLKDKIARDEDKNSALSFIKWLIKEIGVLGLPMSSYYGDDHHHLGENYVRYCLHKKPETLKKAIERLEKLKSL